jgi:hypothetical protein
MKPVLIQVLHVDRAPDRGFGQWIVEFTWREISVHLHKRRLEAAEEEMVASLASVES